MRRRQFFGAVVGAVGLSRMARAQPAAMPVIGFLHAGSPEENVKRLAAFRKGLADAGFVEGRNVTVEYRWASGKNDELPVMVADLIRRKVTVITTPGSTAASVVAKAATSTIPIVFSSGTDPVALGLVASLSRPGGNATGITSLNAELAAKRLGLLHDLVPAASHYFTLVKPTSELARPFLQDLQGASASTGIQSRFSTPIPPTRSTGPLPACRNSPATSWCSVPRDFSSRCYACGDRRRIRNFCDPSSTSSRR